ncbi:MAG: hypothetical protein FJ118_07850 [Deltaproteobacteria bacterium]|nr:hypothetical protein [Deltaproteobacteria bacterium]
MGHKKPVKCLIVFLVILFAWGGWAPCPKRQPSAAVKAALSDHVRAASQAVVVTDNYNNSSSRFGKHRPCCCRHAMPCARKLPPMIASARIWHAQDSQRASDCTGLNGSVPDGIFTTAKPPVISPDVSFLHASLRTAILLI